MPRAGCEHRHVDGAEHFVQKHQHTNLPAHVAPRFDALGDDEVASGPGGGTGLLGRARLPGNQRSATVAQLHERRVGVAVEELDDLYQRRNRGDSATVDEGDQETGSDVLPGRRPALAVDERLHQRGAVEVARTDHAQRTGGGDRVSKAWRTDAAAHRGELDRDLATDQLSKSSPHTARLIAGCWQRGDRPFSPPDRAAPMASHDPD